MVCTSIDPRGPQPPTLLLGTPDQPPACRREGATVRFVDERGQHLGSLFTLRLGGTAEFINYGPPPSILGSMNFYVVVGGRGDDRRSITDEHARLGVITAWVGGVPCGHTNAASADGAGITLGLEPYWEHEACNREGAVLTLVTQDGIALAQQFIVRRGESGILTDFTLAAPFPAAVGHGPPPEAAHTPTAPRTLAWLTALAVALVLGGRMAIAQRPLTRTAAPGWSGRSRRAGPRATRSSRVDRSGCVG